MRSSINLKPVLSFLSDLERNNNRAWFEQNRARYEKARLRFEELVEALISEISKFENLGGLSAKDCVSRIYRDIRFSKDKTPYKNNLSASIAPGGRKSHQQGYYLHLSPHDRSILAGGEYMPEPATLAKWRTAIDRDASALKKIARQKDFVKYFGSIEGDKLATAPKGYARDHPEIELLKMKYFVVVHHLSDKKVLSPDLVPHTVQVFKVMRPFLKYLDEILK